MHACRVLLAASGEIPARILNVRPPRFVGKDRSLVFEVDLSGTAFPLVRANICSVAIPDVPPPDMDTVIRELGIVGTILPYDRLWRSEPFWRCPLHRSSFWVKQAREKSSLLGSSIDSAAVCWIDLCPSTVPPSRRISLKVCFSATRRVHSLEPPAIRPGSLIWLTAARYSWMSWRNCPCRVRRNSCASCRTGLSSRSGRRKRTRLVYV